MAKEINEKSVKKFLKNFDVKPVSVGVEIGEAKLDISVKPLVSTDVMTMMVDLVADSVVQDDVYTPSIVEPAKWAAILCHVANFTTELNDEQFNQLCYCKAVRDAVLSVWSPEQRYDFESAVIDMIDHKRNEILTVQKSRLEAIASQLEITTTYMKNITEGFKNVDPEMMVGVIQKLSGMSELDLGNAVIDIRDARTKLDVVK